MLAPKRPFTSSRTPTAGTASIAISGLTPSGCSQTERVALPERGVDIGNFDAAAVTADESWITISGTGKSSAAYLARVRWSRPNVLAAAGTTSP